MLNNVEWGEFRLQELFRIEGTKSLDSNAIDFLNDGVNFVGRTFENNGIQGKIAQRDFLPNDPYTITATVIGNYKYVKLQKEPYYCSQNINKFTPKSIIKAWNENIAYYFVANIQKFVSLYDKQQGGYKLDDIKNHRIFVPLKNNEIDVNLMENFINKLELERITKLKAYLSATGLDDYTLTHEEQKVLDEYDKVAFGEFDATSIFNIKNTRNILSRDIVENSGETPYLCASSENNGVSSYISYNTDFIDKGNCIFIGGKTFVVSYQENDFYSNDSHNLALYMKDELNTDKYTQLYLATCVDKSLGYKYSWGDSISSTKIKKDTISLPVKNRQPDYETMQTLISAIHKLVIKDVVLYVNSKIPEAKN